jgi:NAD(P)-dependent dehydrogenase (short-subunit alcohol dehydrogenase family)
MRVKLKPVSEQVIVITGATSGIGLATAHEAAARGARLVLVSRDEQDLATVQQDLRDDDAEVIAVAADVADLDAMRQVAREAVGEFGRIDSWVNNAGVTIFGEIEKVAIEEARRLFDTNYWGVVHGSLAALPHLRMHGGALINVGSVLSETGYPLQGHYTASKHAVKGFTDSLRLELQHEEAPVSVSLIQPAAIDTPYTEHGLNLMDVEPKHMPPVYAPEVVAHAILECASHPHRNLRVGGAAKMFTVVEKVAPGLGDRQKMAAFQAQRGDEPPRDDDTLWAPRPGDVRIRGNYPGHVAKSSAYTAAASHPVRTSLVGLAVLGLGVVAARKWMERED